MLNYIEYLEENLGVPGLVITGLVMLFFSIQVIGEFLELKGKVVPEICKIRKYFKRKKQEKLETQETLKKVQLLLADVNAHYSQDNITQRNNWMKWVNDRAVVYDKSIVDITANLTDVTKALNENTKMTEEMFIQSSRDRILDFATKVADDNALVSKEEFNRILKVYDEYELFLEERKKTNGEVAIAYRIINDAYAVRLKNSSFTEDIRGYN